MTRPYWPLCHRADSGAGLSGFPTTVHVFKTFRNRLHNLLRRRQPRLQLFLLTPDFITKIVRPKLIRMPTLENVSGGVDQVHLAFARDVSNPEWASPSHIPWISKQVCEAVILGQYEFPDAVHMSMETLLIFLNPNFPPD
ncbi:hypothetical protein K440DRAFT_18384 [Wilcoxina mikolae CBS 423.85]|nr:hypothetical protein K440DRAFT_18384 [Wilcoxina mikolae CBS 423.85]